jgi:hypothetical protein
MRAGKKTLPPSKVPSITLSKMSSIFADLLSVYKTWPALSSYLTSVEGGALRVDDNSTSEKPFALIRYVKGKSDMTKPHVRAFRSVVWDTLEHRPVSVTPFKSDYGESLPAIDTQTSDYQMEHFVDGVMIGMWFDKYNNVWQYHTRSTIGANCRYYSQTQSFRNMFEYAARALNWDSLDKDACYTWMLQDPENRIVVPVKQPTVYCVQKAKVQGDGSVAFLPFEPAMNPAGSLGTTLKSWDDVRNRVADWNLRFKSGVQGIHIKDATGRRWKLRTQEYNRVRALRGNSPRLDFLWLSAWRNNSLPAYLTLYPEERAASMATIAKWKQVTNAVFHMYVDVFKARSLSKAAIPPKYRPLIYGIHNKYMTELKPAGKSVDWRAVLEYMNSRDIPQMLFVINWDLRQAQQQTGIPQLPFEPPATAGTNVSPVDPEMPPLEEMPPVPA